MKSKSALHFLYMLPPLLIFGGVIFVDPIWSLKANLPTIPFFEIGYATLYLLFFLIYYKSKALRQSPINIVYIILLTYGVFISEQEFIYKYSYIMLLFFSYAYALKNPCKDYDRLLFFLISYIVISVFIYLIRMNMYDFDFLRLRGGINIWGGTTLVSIIYLFITIQAILQKKEGQILLFSAIALFISIIFMTRVTIIVSLLLLLIQLKSLNKLIFFSLIASIVLITLDSDFFEILLSRFSFERVSNNATLIEMVEVLSYDRYALWNKATEILSDNFLGIGVGGMSKYSSYSSAHNLFLNNLIELGAPFGFVVNLLVLVPIYKLIRFPICGKYKVIALTAYAGFLLNAIISGSKLIQTTGYTTAFVLLLLFSVNNVLNYKKIVQ